MDLAADLTRHIKPVNIVRWSPSGEYLASGGDDSTIYIWKIKAESDGNLFGKCWTTVYAAYNLGYDFEYGMFFLRRNKMMMRKKWRNFG